jgi:hypothetical protein
MSRGPGRTRHSFSHSPPEISIDGKLPLSQRACSGSSRVSAEHPRSSRPGHKQYGVSLLPLPICVSDRGQFYNCLRLLSILVLPMFDGKSEPLSREELDEHNQLELERVEQDWVQALSRLCAEIRRSTTIQSLIPHTQRSWKRTTSMLNTSAFTNSCREASRSDCGGRLCPNL